MRPLALTLTLAVALAGCAQTPEAATPTLPTPDPILGPPIRLEPYLSGLSQPILLTHDGEEGELYVVEQGGTILRIVKGERTTWLDVSEDVRAGGEQGLLGFALEPDGDRAYVSYTNAAGDSILERVVDGSREELLEVDQPYSNHNGGHILFGPDGMLYFGLGDGGSAGDPQGNGQDKDALLGSILRLDVGLDAGYRVPDGNPYGTIVWAKGLRNPWRFSFDRATGDLYIGDVGQNRIEEIDFVPAGEGAGWNFGWSVYEGTTRYSVLGQPFSDPVAPVAEYTHDDGCSVTGGHVYRGAAYPGLAGVYFFGDYCSGKIWAMKRDAAGAWQVAELLDTDASISSFGEDAAGELYVVDHGGVILRLVGTGAALPFS